MNLMRNTTDPEQAIEGILIQKVERSHHNIGRQMLAVLTHADAFHPGGSRRFDAVLGVFYNDAMFERDTQFVGRGKEHFRVRLTPVYIVSRYNSLKAPADL